LYLLSLQIQTTIYSTLQKYTTKQEKQTRVITARCGLSITRLAKGFCICEGKIEIESRFC